MTGFRSTGRSTDINKAWIYRPMLHEEEEPSWIDRSPGRPTFSVSPATTEGIERSTGRSTAHLERSFGLSTDSRVRIFFGLDLELFWRFLLLPINRGCNLFLELRVDFLVRVFERTNCNPLVSCVNHQ